MSPPYVDTNTMKSTSDYSTLTRLDKDITDLDSILETIQKEEKSKNIVNGSSTHHHHHYATHEVKPANHTVTTRETTTTTKRTIKDGIY